MFFASSGFAQQCIPSFPYRQGWLGGDAGYSIQIPGQKTLWLFGDTFIGKESAKTRDGSRIIANSIAVSSCNAGIWDIHYSWGIADHENNPTAFFDPKTKNFKYWPLDGVQYGDTVYIALARVRTKTAGKFGFEYIGLDLAKISNLSKRPSEWSVRYIELSSSSVAFPGVSIVKDGSYVYFFTVLDDSAHKFHPITLSRVPLSRLEEPRRYLEYLAADGKWKHGIEWQDALVVMDQGAAEMTVRYHPSLKKWVAIYGKPEFLSSEIIMRTADSLSGPWSPYRPIYKVPEMIPGGSGYDKDNFCYAAKEHPDVGTSDLLITYACNSFSFAKQIKNMGIYRPKAVVVPMSE